MNKVVKFFEIIKSCTEIGIRKSKVFNHHGIFWNDIVSSMIKNQSSIIDPVKPVTMTRGARRTQTQVD